MAATDATGSDGLKKRALVRLAIAGGVTALALAGLWWLDRQGQEAPATTQAPPKPIVHAPPPEPLPPPAEAMEPTAPEAATPAEAGAEVAAPAEAPPPPAAQARPAPPPPQVSNEVALPARPAQAIPYKSEPPPMPAKPEAGPMPPPRAGEYVVQMGVFSNPDNAQELVRRLKAQGIRAYAETRVHVGPFLNRQEAEKARAEMLRLGFKGVVTAGSSQ
jgi:DedD protein